MNKLLREAAMRRAYLAQLEQKFGKAMVDVVDPRGSKPLRRLNSRLTKPSRRNGHPFKESRASDFARRISKRIALGKIDADLVALIRTFSPSPAGDGGC